MPFYTGIKQSHGVKGKHVMSCFIVHSKCNNSRRSYTAPCLANIASNSFSGEDSGEVCCFVTCTYPGEAPRCDMGKVRRILQQEEYHNVWRHWTKFPHEPTEWTKGRWPAASSSSLSSSLPRHCQHYAHVLLKLILLCVCVCVLDPTLYEGPSQQGEGQGAV